MNGMLILAIVLALVAGVAIAWALKERLRAATAEARIGMLQEQGDLVRTQLTQSAANVAEEILRKNDEVVRGREQLAQARLEAQLKPVADTLLKFQEQVTAVEKQRAEETGGLKEQIAQMLQAATATQDEARKLCRAAGASRPCAMCWRPQVSPTATTLTNTPPPTPKRVAAART